METMENVNFKCCNIWGKFNATGMKVYENDEWLVAVRHKQITLGSVVFLLKRHIEAFRDELQ